jgi:hypothetical protein
MDSGGSNRPQDGNAQLAVIADGWALGHQMASKHSRQADASWMAPVK